MPMYLSFIEPASTFNLNYAVGALASPMIGGTAHWGGPVIGALLLSSLQQYVSVTISNEMNVLVVGVLLVVFVVAAPEGVLGLLRNAMAPKPWTREAVQRRVVMIPIVIAAGVALGAVLYVLFDFLIAKGERVIVYSVLALMLPGLLYLAFRFIRWVFNP